MRWIAFEIMFWITAVTGIRDRLRCPRCRSVGTWKPHGSLFDGEDTRKIHRWMCKWCGLYRGPEDETEVVVSTERGCWVLRSSLPHGETPQKRCAGFANPWHG